MTEVTAILGTAVAVGGAVGATGLFVLRAVIATDIKPLNEAMVRLTGTMETFTAAIASETGARKEERNETRDILRDLNAIVHDHETRIRLLEQPPPPPAAMRAGRRRAA